MKNVKLTPIETKFIQTACSLKDFVFQFDISDEAFMDDHGFTKKEAEAAIESLQEKVQP